MTQIKHGLQVIRKRQQDRRVSAELFRQLVYRSETHPNGVAPSFEDQQLVQRNFVERHQWLDRFEIEVFTDEVVATLYQIVCPRLTQQ
jgi:uncharacterized protein YwbE